MATVQGKFFTVKVKDGEEWLALNVAVGHSVPKVRDDLEFSNKGLDGKGSIGGAFKLTVDLSGQYDPTAPAIVRLEEAFDNNETIQLQELRGGTPFRTGLFTILNFTTTLNDNEIAEFTMSCANSDGQGWTAED